MSSKASNTYNNEYNHYNKNSKNNSRKRSKPNKRNNNYNKRTYLNSYKHSSRSNFPRNNKHQQDQYKRGSYHRIRRRGNNRIQQNRNNDYESNNAPYLGTEEHTQQKIRKASDMIKKQLEFDKTNLNQTDKHQYFNDDYDEFMEQERTDRNTNDFTFSFVNNEPETSLSLTESITKNDKKATITTYNIKEIQDQLVKQLCKLTHKEKMNFIKSSSDNYNSAVTQIQTRKRLELSKSLREICSQDILKNNYNDGIIPDIGIKIEDLPNEIIDQITETLNLNEILFDSNSDEENLESSDSIPNIKQEIDSCEEIVEECEEIDNFVIDVKPDLSNLNHSEYVIPENSNSDELITETGMNSSDTINKIIEIDEEIIRLTKTRQELLLKFYENHSSIQNNLPLTNSNLNNDHNPIEINTTKLNFCKEIDLSNIVNEKILVIKIFNNLLLAGTESGKLFFKDLINENFFIIYATTKPITSIVLTKNSNLFLGCLESKLRIYDYNKRLLLKTCIINHCIQCMEVEWDYNFIGLVNGFLLRYSIKKNRIEFEEKISDDTILVLKATQEGARRILLVASKNTPVCIRDAMSGLHMRTMDNLISPTTNCILFEKSLVYCGTNSHDILLFNFHDGNLFKTLKATNSKGISCMKIMNNLLFASCYNGNIYIYNIKNHYYMGFLKGPGGVIISMDIIENLIIAGTLSLQFKSILIPDYFLKSNSD